MGRWSPREAAVEVTLETGYPTAIDDIAARARASHHFLRAAWFAGSGAEGGETLVARSEGGAPLAALPTVAAHALLPRPRALGGGYWPFRAPVLADDLSDQAMAAMVAHPRFNRTLSPIWRMGPVYADDPAAQRLLPTLMRNGWTVLTRRLGRVFRLDLRALRKAGEWPRKSTLRRLRGYERQMGSRGELLFETVTGAGWNAEAFKTLASIERRSWVGRDTDGQGAKFLSSVQRRYWRKAVQDPALARALSASILRLGDRPVAFSFDLRAGALQYAIASSFDAHFSAWRPGKIVTYRQFARAMAEGVETIDLGIGDSGYKREMGAVAGPDINDYLVVRYRPLAALLRRRWEKPSATDDRAGQG